MTAVQYSHRILGVDSKTSLHFPMSQTVSFARPPRVALDRRSCCAALLALAVCGVGATPAAEQARIDRLLDALAQNTAARFIRNGSDHSGAEAADFLRRKRRAYGDRVKTVNEFIDQVASRSSTSGQVYKVRLPDGREVPSTDFLRAELVRLEAGAR